MWRSFNGRKRKSLPYSCRCQKKWILVQKTHVRRLISTFIFKQNWNMITIVSVLYQGGSKKIAKFLSHPQIHFEMIFEAKTSKSAKSMISSIYGLFVVKSENMGFLKASWAHDTLIFLHNCLKYNMTSKVYNTTLQRLAKFFGALFNW